MKTIKDYFTFLIHDNSPPCLYGNFELNRKTSLMFKYTSRRQLRYIWLTEYLTTLTPKELLTYYSLGLVLAQQAEFDMAYKFINYLTEIVNNEQKHSSPISS